MEECLGKLKIGGKQAMNKYFHFFSFSIYHFIHNPMDTWTYADEVNYCHDGKSWKEWNGMG